MNDRIKKIALTLSFGFFLFLTCFAQKRSAAENAGLLEYYYSLAFEQQLYGNLDKALAIYKQCIQIDTTAAAPQYQMAKILIQKRQNLEVVQHLLISASLLEPENDLYLSEVSSFFLQTQQMSRAQESMQKLVELVPDNTNYNYAYARLLVQNQEYEKAIKVYNKLLSQMEDNISLLIERNDVYVKMGAEGELHKELDVLIEKYPNDYRYYLVKGDAYFTAKQYKKAFQVYSDANKRFPENGAVHLALAGYYEMEGNRKQLNKHLRDAFASEEVEVGKKINILTGAAQTDASKSSIDVAPLLDVCLKTHPNDLTVLDFAGRYYFEQGNRDTAVMYFEKVIALDASQKEMWTEVLFHYLEDTTKQEYLDSMCVRAIEEHPTYPVLYLIRGYGKMAQDLYGESIDILEQGLSYCLLESDNFAKMNILSALGDTYYHEKQHKKAFEAYDKALEIDGENLGVLNNYAYYLSELNQDLQKAHDMSHKTILLEPKDATFLDTYAWILYQQGKYQEALHYIELAIEYDDPVSGTLYDHHGDILYKLGMKEEAVKAWKNALERKGDFKEEEIKEITNKIDKVLGDKQ